MANYLLEMQLAEDLTFTEIRFISSALKQGRTIIGYITPKGSSVDKRMGPQKFQFLTINDDQAEIIWLPPSRDGKPYSQEEIAGLKPDQKALLRSKEYEDVNEPRVVAEQQYSLQDLQVIDPTDDSWDDESGILARKAWKRKSRDVEEDAEGVSTLQLIFKDFPAEHDGSLDAYYDLERFTKEIADDIEIERDKKIITIKGEQMDLDEIEDFIHNSRGGPSMAKTYFEAYGVGTDEYRKYATKLTPGQKHKGKINEHDGHGFKPGDAVTIPSKDLSGVVLSREKDDLYKIQLDDSDKITMAYADNMRWAGPMRYEDSDEAEEMLDRIKQRAADRKDASESDRPKSQTKVRTATRKILEKRAVRAARALVFKRLSNGKSKSELLFADRLKIERQMVGEKETINKLAGSLYPIIDQKEQERKLPPI